MPLAGWCRVRGVTACSAGDLHPARKKRERDALTSPERDRHPNVPVPSRVAPAVEARGGLPLLLMVMRQAAIRSPAIGMSAATWSSSAARQSTPYRGSSAVGSQIPLMWYARWRCGPDVARSAIGRATVEGIWLPTALLPRYGVDWRAADDDHVAADIPIAGERVSLHITIDGDGHVRAAHLDRWSDPDGTGTFGWHPFGVEVSASRLFPCGITMPAEGTGGWFHEPAAGTTARSCATPSPSSPSCEREVLVGLTTTELPTPTCWSTSRHRGSVATPVHRSGGSARHRLSFGPRQNDECDHRAATRDDARLTIGRPESPRHPSRFATAPLRRHGYVFRWASKKATIRLRASRADGSW